MQDPGTARMEAFSDGVFAIAATLLVLELNADTSNGTTLGHALLHLWPGYLAYATSFLTIGIIWVNHHQCVQCLDRVDRTMLFVNTLFLMVIAFIPFPTRLVAEHLQGPGEHAATYAYAVTLLAMAITFSGWWRYASHGRRLIAADVPQSRVDAISRAFDPGVPLYLLVLAVAVVSPLASVGLTLALAAFYVPSSALFERKQAA